MHYEEGTNNRELLLWIVGLIIVEPYIMIYSQNKFDHKIEISTFELINSLISLVHDKSMIRIEYATAGSKQVWYDTFVSQQDLAKFLAIYRKRVDNLGSGGSIY
ncbi:unnamed protein product [Rotaria sordida]|uniref:Uncharacterized protein n=1 Tax=Rotaria sordida TaxID=392033 RepID=A0A816EDH0_9BILA|nr:unnamed protein product [Rotaria sordida]CAF1648868.1 unnamed protein product [Rotaria sordida]